MLPASSAPPKLESSRTKRRGSFPPALGESLSKRVAEEQAEAASLASGRGRVAGEQQNHPLPASVQTPESEKPEEAPTSACCSSSPEATGSRSSPASRTAGQASVTNSAGVELPQAKMEKQQQPHFHRKPEDLELAIEVLNDELAEASPLDRPSLELATQTLMERLVEMRKRHSAGDKSADPSGGKKQSTQEFAATLQAVLVGEGTQKYTLIRIPMQDDMSADVYLVRGDPKADYHYQTALDTLNELQERNIMSDVTGGGRMDVLRGEKKVQIYGYSHQYGAADHSITAKMIKDHFGDEFVVSFGDFGY
ncbi:hypothetical protein Efla_003071 [Eimeria flavescens]